MEQDANNKMEALEEKLAEDFAFISSEEEDSPARFELIRKYIKDAIASFEAGDFDDFKHEMTEYYSDEDIENDDPTIRDVIDPREKVAYYIAACHAVFMSGDDEIEEVLDIASSWELPASVRNSDDKEWERMITIIKGWK